MLGPGSVCTTTGIYIIALQVLQRVGTFVPP